MYIMAVFVISQSISFSFSYQIRSYDARVSRRHRKDIFPMEGTAFKKFWISINTELNCNCYVTRKVGPVINKVPFISCHPGKRGNVTAVN